MVMSVTAKTQFAGMFRETIIEITSDSSGEAEGTIEFGNGCAWGAVMKPGAEGDQPSDQFTLKLLDSQGVDILGGQGAALSNSSDTEIAPEDMGYRAMIGDLTLRAEGMGGGKKATLVIRHYNG